MSKPDAPAVLTVTATAVVTDADGNPINNEESP